MKKALLPALALFIFASCGNKEKLREVDVPSVALDNDRNRSVGNPADVKAKDGVFRMPTLNFDYDDLTPEMSAQTIANHYAKIHLKYTENLNIAVKGTEMEAQSIEEILGALPADNEFLKTNAGGYYNHNLFWESLSPKGGGEPNGKIGTYINRDFGSFANFKKEFAQKAKNIFGSGWVWVILKNNGTVAITTTNNEDNPLMPSSVERGLPLFNLDMWEHAYYLQHKSNKQSYIDSFFKQVDWGKINYRIDLNMQ